MIETRRFMGTASVLMAVIILLALAASPAAAADDAAADVLLADIQTRSGRVDSRIAGDGTFLSHFDVVFNLVDADTAQATNLAPDPEAKKPMIKICGHDQEVSGIKRTRVESSSPHHSFTVYTKPGVAPWNRNAALPDHILIEHEGSTWHLEIPEWNRSARVDEHGRVLDMVPHMEPLWAEHDHCADLDAYLDEMRAIERRELSEREARDAARLMRGEPVAMTVAPAPAPARPYMRCSEFGSRAQYEAYYGDNPPARHDRDKDGIYCENLG